MPGSLPFYRQAYKIKSVASENHKRNCQTDLNCRRRSGGCMITAFTTDLPDITTFATATTAVATTATTAAITAATAAIVAALFPFENKQKNNKKKRNLEV